MGTVVAFVLLPSTDDAAHGESVEAAEAAADEAAESGDDDADAEKTRGLSSAASKRGVPATGSVGGPTDGGVSAGWRAG